MGHSVGSLGIFERSKVERAGRLNVWTPALSFFRDGVLVQGIVGIGVGLDLIDVVHGTSVGLGAGGNL